MKKRMCISVAWALLLAMISMFGGCSSVIERESGTENGFNYVIFEDDTAMITGYGGEDVDIVTPSTIKGCTVRSIEQGAFADHKTLRSVTVTGNVEVGETVYGRYTPGCGVFEGCTSLETVILSEGVYGIASRAFHGCSALTTVQLPSSIRSIDKYGYDPLFSDCSSLKNVTIGDGARDLSHDMFNDTAYYRDESHWDHGVLYVGNHLIQADDALKGVYVVREGTVSVAVCAFYECTYLTEVTVPSSVKRIGGGAFRDCSSLVLISLPDALVEIGEGAFDCTGYYRNSSNWLDGVLYIGNHLIEAKDTLAGEYVVREGTITIAEDAFENCSELTKVQLPDSVQWIGNRAFLGCDSLEEKPSV